MTTTESTPGSTSGAGVPDALERRDGVHTLSDELSRLMRVVHALKSQAQTGAGPDVARQRAAHVLLFPLARLGALRQGALAETVHADPSTVSRHVTVLVDGGLVQRVADAHDGRASQLVITPAGQAVVEGMHAEREALFETVTRDWPVEDVTAFGCLLRRFVEDLTDALPGLGAAASPAAATAAPRDPAAAAGDQQTRHTPEKDR